MARLLFLAALTAGLTLTGWVGGTEKPPVSRPASRVPAWDQRGLGPLPPQGVCCLAVNAAGTFVAVGTSAPPGQPNIFLLNGAGQVVRQQHAGMRWINAVAVDEAGAVVRALSTTPRGSAGDTPRVFTLSSDGHITEEAAPANADVFYYGRHSNHVGAHLRSYRSGALAVYQTQASWLSQVGARPAPALPLTHDVHAITVALAVDPTGRAVIGCAASADPDPRQPKMIPHNLFVVSPEQKFPLWGRPVSTDTAAAPAPLPGLYGKPIPNNRHARVENLYWDRPANTDTAAVLNRRHPLVHDFAQRDDKVWAPLAVALHITNPKAQQWQVASADYQGWLRWARSSATNKLQSRGVRFLPSRPTITVYDETGVVRRRFAATVFAHPFWCDLLFTADGNKLLAYPHHWTSRGLAGQTVLPADEHARDLYVLDIGTGKVERIEFPDAISDVATAAETTVVGCWDGRVYVLDNARIGQGPLPAGIDVGGPSLVRFSGDGSRLVIATTAGEVRMLDGARKERWRADLKRLARASGKPLPPPAAAQQLQPGLYRVAGGFTESDLGTQYLIKAPHGLILLDPNGGLSFERQFASIQKAGFDPMQVKYVLATHEHGDHAPGAYLWRVVSGAQFICSREMAYALGQEMPQQTGYGFHPPVPVDVQLDKDTELDLSGLKVQAIRLPGHTYGSMGWVFRVGGKKYVATGDLIMPNGVLGYAGSLNFSAPQVLNSLRKVESQKADLILGGHGASGVPPERFIAVAIQAGVATGWGKIPAAKPNPRYGVENENCLVVGWHRGAVATDGGDVNGDGKPDVVLLTTADKGCAVQVYLNKGGRFDDKPDQVIDLPAVAHANRICITNINDDGVADFLVSGQPSALLISQLDRRSYRVVSLEKLAYAPAGIRKIIRLDKNADGRTKFLFAPRVGNYVVAEADKALGLKPSSLGVHLGGVYVDIHMGDLNGDSRPDLVTSAGDVFLRQKDGKLPNKPSFRVSPFDKPSFVFLAAADFSGDGRTDLAFVKGDAVAFFANTGQAERPFADKPDRVLTLPFSKAVYHNQALRDSPTVADFNGDGTPDLVVCQSQGRKALVLLGGAPSGLVLPRSRLLTLDCYLYFEQRAVVADFNGDGQADLAVFGYNVLGPTAAPWSAPTGVFLWLHDRDKTSR